MLMYNYDNKGYHDYSAIIVDGQIAGTRQRYKNEAETTLFNKLSNTHLLSVKNAVKEYLLCLSIAIILQSSNPAIFQSF